MVFSPEYCSPGFSWSMDWGPSTYHRMAKHEYWYSCVLSSDLINVCKHISDIMREILDLCPFSFTPAMADWKKRWEKKFKMTVGDKDIFFFTYFSRVQRIRRLTLNGDGRNVAVLKHDWLKLLCHYFIQLQATGDLHVIFRPPVDPHASLASTSWNATKICVFFWCIEII